MQKLLLALLVSGVVMAEEPPAKRADRVIHFTAERFAFTPSRIKIKQGMEVKLVVTSEDTDHGFRISAAGIDAAVPQAGKGELRISFLANKKGRYAFECSRPCGAGHNLMRGEITVE